MPQPAKPLPQAALAQDLARQMDECRAPNKKHPVHSRQKKNCGRVTEQERHRAEPEDKAERNPRRILGKQSKLYGIPKVG